MSEFRKLSDAVYASAQIALEDVAQAASMGVQLIINNRPEGEADDQIPGPEIEAAARAAGMDYIAIPISLPNLSQADIDATVDALAKTSGPVLAYCRSGNRSTLVWALAQSKAGASPDEIASAAAEAGYDVSPVRAAMEALASQA